MKKLLSNGIEVPIVGFGTARLNGDECIQTIQEAICAGYRLFDCAERYENETELGIAVKNSGIDRKEFFITTKVWCQNNGYENTLRAFDISLRKLDMDYVDMYMIHQPIGDYYGSWRAITELYDKGLVRAAGICNFGAERLMDLYLNTEIKPMINQIKCNPYFRQFEIVDIWNNLGVAVECWAPLGEGNKEMLSNPVITKIAEGKGKTPAQIILRDSYERGMIIIPKAGNKEHIIENMKIFDFELNEEERAEINGLDLGVVTYPYQFSLTKYLYEWKLS